MPSLKDIEDRQKRLKALTEQLQREDDMNRYLQVVQQMENEARELEGIALAFEAENQRQKKAPRGSVEILLTPEQRSRIQRETGISMTTVVISDPGGDVNKAMPIARPDQIEAEALKQAKAQKAEREAKENARMSLERELHSLETQNELMAEQVAKIREKPETKAILNPKT